jgi:hypothetical protein
MCESVDVRFVHLVQHPEYPDTLAVGCVCAEHMEEDYMRPRAREKRLRSAASRRRTWTTRQWRASEKGNPYLNTEGFNLTIFPYGAYWTVSVRNRANGKSRIGVKAHENKDAAKAAALNALLWAKEHLTEPHHRNANERGNQWPRHAILRKQSATKAEKTRWHWSWAVRLSMPAVRCRTASAKTAYTSM